MIYLLRLPCFLDKDGKNFGTVLKFGFSDNYKSRKAQYSSYHPYIIELKQYEDGTLDDETRLKAYFKDKGLLMTGREWIKDCPESLQIFNNAPNIDDLRKFLDKQKLGKLTWIRKVQEVDKAFIRLLCDRGYSDYELKKKIEVLKHYSNEDQIKILHMHLNISEKDILRYVMKFYNKIGSSAIIQEFIEKFSDIRSTTKRLMTLVDFYNNHKDDYKTIDEIFKLIPQKYKDYFSVLGPDRIKGLGYQESKIKQEIKDLMSNSEAKNLVVTEIYDTFEIGKKYSSEYIRETLNNIYERAGYTKTPKASILKTYFKMKTAKVKNESDKWLNGFEILEVIKK